jgi:hypothetical protein
MPKKRNRPTHRKPLLPVFHIYCEGEKTEPNYLKSYLERAHPGNRRLNVVKVEKTSKTTPKQLVDEAIKAKKDRHSPKGDIFWVVYDRENKSKYSDDLHRQAYTKANQNKIGVALSNVCFEVWILLHFEHCTAAYTCYDDLRRRSNLKAHLPNYEKGDKSMFDNMLDNIDIAKRNAISMNRITIESSDPSWTKPFQWNPYTDVYKLIDDIEEFIENLAK